MLAIGVYRRLSNGGEPLQPNDNRVVVAAGIADDKQLPVLIPAAYNAYMGVLQVKHQITGQSTLPGLS